MEGSSSSLSFVEIFSGSLHFMDYSLARSPFFLFFFVLLGFQTSSVI